MLCIRRREEEGLGGGGHLGFLLYRSAVLNVFALLYFTFTVMALAVPMNETLSVRHLCSTHTKAKVF